MSFQSYDNFSYFYDHEQLAINGFGISEFIPIPPELINERRDIINNLADPAYLAKETGLPLGMINEFMTKNCCTDMVAVWVWVFKWNHGGTLCIL